MTDYQADQTLQEWYHSLNNTIPRSENGQGSWIRGSSAGNKGWQTADDYTFRGAWIEDLTAPWRAGVAPTFEAAARGGRRGKAGRGGNPQDRQGSKRKRADTEYHRKCQARLAVRHDLSTCYYIVTELAPEFWKPNFAVKGLIQHRIENEPSLGS